MRLLLAVTLTLALAPAARAADPPRFGPPIKLDPAGGTEPRVAVAANDHRFVVTNKDDGTAVVFRSADGGVSWAEAGDPFPGQSQPTIDVDVVTMPDGSLLASELDGAGLNFPSAVSPDEGKTWTASTGTNYADQDRQFFAVGPPSPGSTKPTVYLTWHNLTSGSAVHNVFVAKSTDGGVTFGPLVPVTAPGDQAFSDLQCAAGYPSSIAVDQKTGRIYDFFITRSQPVQAGLNAGGCGASVFGPFEVNIIGATRVWVATSPDGSPGSWTQSLAVDRADTGQVVATQFAPGTLDNQGNPWVVFSETPKAYPDYRGAAVKVVHSDPKMTKWSDPLTVVPAGGPGTILPHIAAGDPGKIGVAYFQGEGNPDDADWYAHVATVFNAGSTTPEIHDERISPVVNYIGSASALEAACSGEGPAEGIENGFTCPRASDVFGMALDRDCRITVTWPSVSSDRNDSPGTWVATQTGGSGLCGEAASHGGSQAPVGPFCRDTIPPSLTVRARRRHGRLKLSGTATDRGCAGQTPDRPLRGNVARVEVRVGRRWVRARGTARWSLTVRARKRVTLRVRAIDRSGNVSGVRRVSR